MLSLLPNLQYVQKFKVTILSEKVQTGIKRMIKSRK